MIVRIATEGQYRIPDGEATGLNELDDEAIAACEAGDEQRFHSSFAKLIEMVRTKGVKVGEDELFGSDLILPPADASLEEAKAEFSGEGLIPG